MYLYQRVATRVISFLIICGVCGGAAYAFDGIPRDKKEYAKSELLIGASSVNSDEDAVLDAGIKVSLADGWKMYWRNPGDAGFPLSIKWDNSKNVSDVTMLWPAPTRFLESWGLEVFGYKKEVVFPLRVTLKNKEKATTLELQADYSICSDICIPYKETLTKEIKPGLKPDKKQVKQIEAYQKYVPTKSDAKGLSIDNVQWASEELKGGVLKVRVLSAHEDISEADVFVEVIDGKNFRFPKPQKKKHNLKAGYKTIFTFRYEKSDAATLADKKLMLTVVNDKKAVEKEFSTSAEPAGDSAF